MAINEKGGIRIPIVTYFSDKGVKAASTSLMGLETAASKLAKTFGVTLGAAAITSFGKKALDVFAKEQKAMSQLTNTLYGLGLAYKGIGVNQYLNDLQDATGVAKDQLAPALQTLTTYTLDYAKSQEILNTALNLSAAGYGDIETTATALGKAYTGNYKGLIGLNAGITATTVKTQSFAQIMEQLNTTFKDAALLDNYKTRLDKIKVAATDAISYIGQGIGEALNVLTDNQNIKGTMETIRNFGKVISEEIVGFAAGIRQLFKDISEIPLVKLVLSLGGAALKFIDKVLGISKAAKADIANFNKKAAADQAKADAKAKAAAEAQAKLNAKLKAQQLADQKKLNAEKAKGVALDKASAVLAQAQTIFNDEQIQLAAAMSNSSLSASDRLRVQLKKDLLDLQDAINAKDAVAATALAEKVNQDYKLLAAYQAQNVQAQIQANLIAQIKALSDGLPEDKNLINIKNLQDAFLALTEILNKLGQISTKVAGTGVTVPVVPGTKDYGGNVIGSEVPASVADMYKSIFGNGTTDYAGNFIGTAANVSALGGISIPTMSPNAFGPQAVTVTIVDNTSGLINVVTDATQQATANGINTRLVRNTGGLNW